MLTWVPLSTDRMSPCTPSCTRCADPEVRCRVLLLSERKFGTTDEVSRTDLARA